jgi:hypothetical protein
MLKHKVNFSNSTTKWNCELHEMKEHQIISSYGESESNAGLIIDQTFG